jgi:TPR repeat protein
LPRVFDLKDVTLPIGSALVFGVTGQDDAIFVAWQLILKNCQLNKPRARLYVSRMRKSILALALLPIFSLMALGQSALDDLSLEKKLTLAKAGDEEAQIAVAQAYEQGIGANLSKVEAAKWYRAAAQQGNAEGQFRLARLVHEGGEGLKKSPEIAVQLYKSAADQGHAMAQNWLGYCYQRGIGIAAKDETAVEWYGKAADQGLAVAQNNLALMHLNGKGTPRDFAKAFALFKVAADQGDGWGLNNLAGMYEMGWGVAQDPKQASALYRKAAEAGNSAAGDNLKRLTGTVVTPD